ncbi:DUF3231 family protein [Bacillus sp. V33-4]|uniref:DUF3231 family protein n=1 Tax=Bacillus sp. V33-4 TaxID=2054169 RepID=UPI000C7734D8|nr:DUF3231 family protein [Bacillus sp. V33-4]PLR83843.1 hypothetical protein CVD23_13260 [Bacillus sp. V33-4]
MNFFQLTKDAFEQFTDKEMKPLHVGEVMNLWFYLIGTKQTLRGDEISRNICQDEDLKKKLDEAINDVHRPMVKELEEFFLKEGVPLPDTTPEKNVGDYRSIPDGAKMNDEEIANFLAYNLVVGITSAVRGMTEAVRVDVAYMFLKYQMMKVAYSVSFKKMMEDKGWLKTPPFYNQERHK